MAAQTAHAVPQSDPAADPKALRRVAAASFIGSAVEWYDFFLYGSAAALVFSVLFFPAQDPLSGTLLAFATFGVGFLARPLGGILAGHMGDRIGRKRTLVVTLLLTGVSTGLIGLLPTTDVIGVAAPIILVVLRLIQGLGVGGEWGGGALIAVEHAPKGRRGFFGTFPQLGTPAGMLLATGAIAIVSTLPEEQFLSWGWRVPFLFSFLLVGVGLYIRFRIPEPAVFAQIKGKDVTEGRLPIVEVLRRYPKTVLLAAGMRFSDNVLYYIFATFSLTYITTVLELPRSAALLGVLVAAALELFTMPFFGALSDRVGRKPVVAAAAAATILVPFIWFPLVNTGNEILIVLASALALSVVHAAVYAPLAAWFSEQFGTGVRYSGISVGYQLGSMLAGAPTPIVAVALLAAFPGQWWPIALMLVIAGAVTLICALLARDASRAESDELQRA